MAKVTVALNGRILEGSSLENMDLEEIKALWESEVAASNRPHHHKVYYSSASQVVWRDTNLGMVLTAWVNNKSDAVSFQALEMG